MKYFKLGLIFVNVVVGYSFIIHEYLGEILENSIKNELPNEYNFLKNIIGDFKKNSTWADKYKFKYPWTKSFHYIDILECGKLKNNCCNNIENLPYNIQYLSENNYSNLTLNQNWLLYIHLLQDLFQPLHLYGLYRGGNDFKVQLYFSRFKRKTNMHSIFDLHLPQYFLSDKIEKKCCNNQNLKELSNFTLNAVSINSLIQNHINFICNNNIYNLNEIILKDFYNEINYKIYFKQLLCNYEKLSMYFINKKLNL